MIHRLLSSCDGWGDSMASDLVFAADSRFPQAKSGSET